MNRLLSIAAGVGALCLARPAGAQLAELEKGVTLGEWTFRPIIGLRTRGEYRHAPVDTGGDEYTSDAVLHDAFRQAVPQRLALGEAVDHQWLLAERARLGLEVDYDEIVTARLVLQDARVLGIAAGATEGSGNLASFEPHEAYISIREEDDLVRCRLGRQRPQWGDGRLIGSSEFGPKGAALDAADLAFRVDDFDLELLAALLAPPGELPPSTGAPAADAAPKGTGAQLYGLRTSYRPYPYFGVELVGLGRVVRQPVLDTLTPSDVGVVDLRLFGDYRGVVYSAEAAVEFGRSASYGDARPLLAFAVAADVLWTTSLPGRLGFGAFGSYASGESQAGDPGETMNRFDPILPDVHDHGGLMDLYGWSNSFDAGARFETQPDDIVRFGLQGAFAGLATPGDRWSTEALRPVGAAPDNESAVLGGELDAELKIDPWDRVGFDAGYGVFILGEGGKNVLAAAGRGDRDVLHWAYVQARLEID